MARGRLTPLIVASVFLIALPTAAQRGRPPPTGGGGGAVVAAGGGGSVENEKVEELSLAVGETKSISAKETRNFSVADPAIIDVRVSPDGQTFLIVGRKPGSTTMVLIKNDGSQTTWSINVSTRPPEIVYRELQQLLEGTTGVRVRRVGGRFFLEGGVTTDTELKRLSLISALYPGQVENLVQVGSGSGDRRILIRIDFFFVSYDKSSSYQVGIGYPAAIGGDTVGTLNATFDLLSTSINPAQATLANQPLPRLDIAANNGWAKVLKQSSIITSNGQEAIFNSGGEVNFRQFAFSNTSGLQKIAFGTNVTCLPRYDSTTREIEDGSARSHEAGASADSRGYQERVADSRGRWPAPLEPNPSPGYPFRQPLEQTSRDGKRHLRHPERGGDGPEVVARSGQKRAVRFRRLQRRHRQREHL
jgi:hypothetical protein